MFPCHVQFPTHIYTQAITVAVDTSVVSVLVCCVVFIGMFNINLKINYFSPLMKSVSYVSFF